MHEVLSLECKDKPLKPFILLSTSHTIPGLCICPPAYGDTDGFIAKASLCAISSLCAVVFTMCAHVRA